jgi:hypothetical protein
VKFLRQNSKKLFRKINGIEQIHAYQIFTATHAEANTIKTKLDLGLNFIDLAKTTIPLPGDLDWVARGFWFIRTWKMRFLPSNRKLQRYHRDDIGFHICMPRRDQRTCTDTASRQFSNTRSYRIGSRNKRIFAENHHAE